MGHCFEWEGHYFGWVEVGGELFWVCGGRWGIILGGLGVGGDEYVWVGVSWGGCTI